MTNFNEYLQYNQETGNIIWLKDKGTKKLIGQIAGNLNNNGYIQIKFDGKLYKAHRLAWYLHHGVWPQNEIDHINGIRNDNRINNLRDVTKNENLLNQKRHREKTVKYYYYDKNKQIWQVEKRINGKLKHFGCFDSKELALQFIQDNINLFPGAKPFECKI
jgi:hypothetical protein